jgi:hypothetical protein
MPPGKKKPVITINPLFKLLIVINSVLCVVTLTVMLWVAWTTPDPMPRAREQLFATCETIFKLTAGAFIGLLGGRAASPDRVQEVQPKTEQEPAAKPEA